MYPSLPQIPSLLPGTPRHHSSRGDVIQSSSRSSLGTRNSRAGEDLVA